MIETKANVADFLTHRSGLAPRNNIWNLEFGQVALEHRDAMPIVNNLEKYAIADELIMALSCELSWGVALKKNIFDPLAVDRTITSNESKLDNRAEPYMSLADGTPYHLAPRPQFEDGRIMQGAVGLQKTQHDINSEQPASAVTNPTQSTHTDISVAIWTGECLCFRLLVLSNGFANNDVSDWIGQMLLECVLDNPQKNDYVELAKISAKNYVARWPKIKADRERERIPESVHQPLALYVGKFYNKPENLYIEDSAEWRGT
ncbi:uncharacterized protein RAG0_11482 [Rhynchosporium agropyri]|uniref:Beta-lactamase-related domain-containing protein n=1 Tax=Rhynchosporium agropyri TaxID=914238 RepID=A0A1E1L485_9HELO|nr:uncharacterized protein RAG0_11482 [Rhynchosporium agropyri]